MTANMNKFKAGDKVKVDYDATIYEVIEFDQAFQLYVVSSGKDKDANGQDVTHGYTERALKPVSLPFSTNNGVFNIPDESRINFNVLFDEMYKEAIGKFMDKKIIISETKGCLHEFKEYFGLNERFTYCTKCDQKRGHL